MGKLLLLHLENFDFLERIFIWKSIQIALESSSTGIFQKKGQNKSWDVSYGILCQNMTKIRKEVSQIANEKWSHTILSWFKYILKPPKIHDLPVLNW